MRAAGYCSAAKPSYASKQASEAQLVCCGHSPAAAGHAHTTSAKADTSSSWPHAVPPPAVVACWAGRLVSRLARCAAPTKPRCGSSAARLGGKGGRHHRYKDVDAGRGPESCEQAKAGPADLAPSGGGCCAEQAAAARRMMPAPNAGTAIAPFSQRTLQIIQAAQGPVRRCQLAEACRRLEAGCLLAMS